MTTAHRPTFDPARGGSGKSEAALSSMSKQYSARDLPGHKTLKYRQEGQTTQEEIRSKDYKRDLEEREFAAASSKTSSHEAAKRSAAPSVQSNSVAPPKKSRPEGGVVNLDADDALDEDESVSASSGEDDDDTEELMRELEKIRKERALEAARQEAERRAEEERIRTENIVKGNPLLNQAEKQSDFKVRRRWDDDSVFKNCARDQDSNRGFVNDMLRTEFHKRFMDKYIK